MLPWTWLYVVWSHVLILLLQHFYVFLQKKLCEILGCLFSLFFVANDNYHFFFVERRKLASLISSSNLGLHPLLFPLPHMHTTLVDSGNSQGEEEKEEEEEGGVLNALFVRFPGWGFSPLSIVSRGRCRCVGLEHVPPPLLLLLLLPWPVRLKNLGISSMDFGRRSSS